MTSRQAGRRIAAGTRRRSRSVRNGTRKGEPLAAKDLRLMLRLVACGGIFVALVAAKLLLPAKMAAFNETLSAAMEQNMDVQAVFSAVGRAFSGEEGGGMGEVYQAVFHPQEGAFQAGAAGTAEAPVKMTTQKATLRDSAALDLLRGFRAEPGAPSGPPEAPGPEGQPASSLAYVLYSQENLPEGVSMEQALLGFDYSAPVAGTLSSGFGYREHPTEGEERFHYGVDLAADTGAEVRCFADGTVTAVGDSSSYGRYCVVAHEGGYSTLYAHCSRVTASSGTAVKRGQKIAEVGETGMATGPHLHFELQREGTYLNPVYYVSAL
ncbi:MAG: M23 family metallopeptidase [Oscillibacter sp.]|jgi:murein DD-endopeptidase MepM/ murein hydrolase activator NlpD|uniref:M23 family metallopeptidase n=1 Tax=uncultured Oscillibacter sp. TaxID=876091 RepID=UPI00216EC9D5|nr:M23 family metallopeptidase [uncultured Oscillibacter sp.]MCI9644647.1 M23 family metallopeptidase [Oscillibacter sp.]